MGLFNDIKSAWGVRPGAQAARAPAKPVAAPELETVPPARPQKRVLFVEGDAAVCGEFVRLVHQRRPSWELVTVPNAKDALDQITPGSFDAVVASARLTGKSSVEFLNEVGRRHPGLPRLIRYAPEDKSLLRGFAGWTLLHLTREMDSTEIEEGLECAFQLGEWTRQEALRTLLPKMVRIPAMPDLYTQVLNLLASPTADAADVGKLISTEPALTAKMLQLVNSAAFALAHHITNAVEAVMFLGAERTKALILMANTSLHFDLSGCEGFSQEQFWRHSLATAGLARSITLLETHDAKFADEAFTAGLLHDVGKLLLAANVTAPYSRTVSIAKIQRLTEWEAERMEFGTSHAELGACLLGTWGLPLRFLRHRLASRAGAIR